MRGVKKCELLFLCDLLKSLCEHSGSVRTKEGGGSVLSLFSGEQLMPHCLTLDPIYMLFLLPLYLILKVCQSQSFCLLRISLTSVCVHARICVYLEGKPAGVFFSCADCSALYQNHTAEALSGKHSISVKSVLRCMQLQRSNYARFESTDTPMSKTDSINHTQSLVGKYTFFLYSFEGLAIQHKP